MKRFFFLLFTLLFVGVGIEVKAAPAYLDIGLSEFTISEYSEGVTIGETMVILDLNFYIFQAGFGARLVPVDIGEYPLLPFLDVQTEGVIYNNLIASRQNRISLYPEKIQQEYSETISYRRFGFGQINRWTLTTAQNLRC